MKKAKPILFFSGGTGPATLSRHLAKASIPSVHIISTFDAGRSSRELRRTFAIPAVGDLRNRLLALADLTATSPAVMDFLSFRLPAKGDQDFLRESLRMLGNRENAIWGPIPVFERENLYSGMKMFLERMPASFNPLNASMGNLILAGFYLGFNRNFDPALNAFSSLVHAKGTVLPVCSESLHLAAELQHGGKIVGQDKFKFLHEKIIKIFLTVHEPREGSAFDETPCRPPLYHSAQANIKNSAVICFPMGSFYSSILANTLVKGVGRAISQNSCPKIFIPNSGNDPEICGLDIAEQTGILLEQLKRDAPWAANTDLLNYVLLDCDNGIYPGGLGSNVIEKLAKLGIKPVFSPIVNKFKPNRHDPVSIIETIKLLAGYEYLCT